MQKKWGISILFTLLFSCATSYQKLGFSGGYSEIQLDENIFRISYEGNEHTSKEIVYEYTLLRSAEITLQHEYKYFVILDENQYLLTNGYQKGEQVKSTIKTMASNNEIVTEEETVILKGDTSEGSASMSHSTIACFKEKPTNTFSYNAKITYESIRKKYGIENDE